MVYQHLDQKEEFESDNPDSNLDSFGTCNHDIQLLNLDEDEPGIIEHEASSIKEQIWRTWYYVKAKSSELLGFTNSESYAALGSHQQNVDELTDQMSEEISASWIGRYTFSWIDNKLKLGMERPLFIKDLDKMQPLHDPANVGNVLEEEWNKELGKCRTKMLEAEQSEEVELDKLLQHVDDEDENKVEHPEAPSLKWVLIRTYYKEYLKAAIPRALRIMAAATVPFFQNQIITLMEDRYSNHTPSTWKTYVYGLLMVFGILFATNFASVVAQKYWYIVCCSSLHVKNGLSHLIYKKLLKLSVKSKQSNIAGKLSNLMSSDTQRLMDLFGPMHFFWAAPFASAISFVGIALTIGFVSTLAGYSVILVMVPLTIAVTKKLHKVRKDTITQTDSRVKSATEIFHTMKVVKMYALEEKMGNKASGDRHIELHFIKRFQLWSALHRSLNEILVPMMCLASIVTYILLGKSLTTAQAFTVIGLFSELAFPIKNIAMLAGTVVEAQVSIGRISRFLSLSEKPSPVRDDGIEQGNIEIEYGTFHWDPSKTDSPALHNVQLKINRGDLVCIMGSVGSGKSSLLNSLLGEMACSNGTIKAKGSICYVPQITFLLHATIRENICFGKPYDEEKYQRVVHACALPKDFDMLLAGDLTVVGERGINLSGGQKARISMARAVYGDSDIYLLDDPLSAVDAHVSHTLFHDCIQKLLKGKTVLLVTHQLQFVSHGDKLIVMQDGKIMVAGSPEEVTKAGVDLKALLEMYHGQMKEKMAAESSNQASSSNESIHEIFSEPNTKDGEQDAEKKNEQAAAAASAANIQQAEERGVGTMGIEVYKFYFAPLKWLWLGALIVLLLHRALDALLMYWIAKWSSDSKPTTNDPPLPSSNPVASTRTFLIGFSIGNAVLAVLMMAKEAAVLMVAAWTGEIVYMKMFNKLLRAPMSFFDTTPKGRITARCSSDTDAMDNQVGAIFMQLGACLVMLAFTLLMIASSMLAWALIFVPMIFIYIALYNRFVPAYREIARLNGLSKAPLFSQFGETLDGLYTLRAFKRESSFLNLLYVNLDRHQRSIFYHTICGLWLSVRCIFLSSLIVVLIALFAVLNPYAHPAIVSVALGYAILNAGQTEWLLLAISSVQAKMNCVERIQQYTAVEVERPPVIESYRPPENWPNRGLVEFQNVTMHYRPGLPPVLNDVSFTIKPSEKIGVVGRTGAGKSSLLSTILSLVPISSGTISIDGYDISRMGVTDLRSKISIIPQDPTIFSGNIRNNLDPFDQHTEMDLWNVLDRVRIRSSIESLPEKLDTELAEDGSNLSLGQRQLLCVARALLKRSKILLLDEASSSIDLETDHILQKTLREEFGDCTTITIAHRLATILDCDRILVMDAGKVVEFDTPDHLLKNPNGLFFSLYQQSRKSALKHTN